VRVPVASGSVALIDAVRALDAEHVPVADLGLRRPSLDDVFMSLTGHHAIEARPVAAQPTNARSRGMIG
jgi:ABC-2 type transport system ATP-binding protein